MRKILKKFEVTDIRNLTNYQINKLEVGDVVAKNTNGQLHHYIVSYKQNNVGICLTYTDATYCETISYDYTDGNWVYNSQDSTVIASKSYVDSLMSGALKREIVEALPETDIDTNTIYMILDNSSSQQGNVYNEYMYIENAWELIGTTATSSTSKYRHTLCLSRTASVSYNINIDIIKDNNTQITFNDLVTLLYTKGYTSSSKRYTANGILSQSTALDGIVIGIYSDNTKLYIVYCYQSGTPTTYSIESFTYSEDIVSEE